MAETIEIARLGHLGDGIADTRQGPLFVPFALPGERVSIEREARGDRARLARVLAPSRQRVPPPCPHFGICGGCALQHMSLEAQAAFKREAVASAFAARGLRPEIAPVVTVTPGSRRRAVFAARRDPKGVAFGFFGRASHRIAGIEACLVLTPGITDALPRLRRLAGRVASTGGDTRITVLDTTAGLDVSVTGADRRAARDLAGLSRLAVELDLARLSVAGEVIIEARPPALSIGGIAVVPPPGGFVQAVAEAEEAMAAEVLAGIGGARHVADLYAGIGTFALRLAARAQVHAVESNRAALAALDRAWRQAGGRKAVTSEARDLDRRPLMPTELERFGAVVFDPPRAGADAQARQIACSRVARVVAVSCNPATLARDARTLVDGGYRLGRVVPVDQFLFSPHIEVVATFSRE